MNEFLRPINDKFQKEKSLFVVGDTDWLGKQPVKLPAGTCIIRAIDLFGAGADHSRYSILMVFSKICSSRKT
ncbi:hypothetical protein N9Z53_00400 [Mariniblastus sp.]|nr:hypothetical protein [Mariniblastus sp.]